MADNLTTTPVPLSRNLGTLTSWNPLGHSGPVTGLLYLLPVIDPPTVKENISFDQTVCFHCSTVYFRNV
jgi:hypothetical protein